MFLFCIYCLYTFNSSAFLPGKTIITSFSNHLIKTSERNVDIPDEIIFFPVPKEFNSQVLAG